MEKYRPAGRSAPGSCVSMTPPRRWASTSAPASWSTRRSRSDTTPAQHGRRCGERSGGSPCTPVSDTPERSPTTTSPRHWRPSGCSANARTCTTSTPRRRTSSTSAPSSGSPTCTSYKWCCSTAAKSPPSRASSCRPGNPRWCCLHRCRRWRQMAGRPAPHRRTSDRGEAGDRRPPLRRMARRTPARCRVLRRRDPRALPGLGRIIGRGADREDRQAAGRGHPDPADLRTVPAVS